MKVLIVVFLLAVAALGVSAQKTKAKKARKKPVSDVTTVHNNVFPREKFDPARDPKADLDDAIAKASASNKRIILDVGGEWCGWCVYMDKFFLENPKLSKLRDDNYLWIKINMSEENENEPFLSAYPEIQGYPHLLIMDEKGTLLHSQDTSKLETGKGYNLAAFTNFLKKWAPLKK